MEEKEDYDDEGEEEEEEEEHDMRRYAIFAAERWKSPQMKKIPGPKKALNAVLPRSKSTYYLDESNWKVELNHPLLEAFQLKSDELFMFEGFMIGTTSMEITHPPPSKKKKPTKCGTLLKPKLTPLLQNSTPSSFGNGDETVYDETIRKGREIKHSHLSIPFNADDIPKREIKTALFPSADDIQFVFSKMAIYEPGGHFQDHRDTARSHDHQGTLLIEVRTTHKGGDLILTHNGVEACWSLETPDVETEVSPDGLTDHVRFIAFFTDVTHRVEAIESGVRIVLQYEIHVIPRSGSSDRELDLEREEGREEFPDKEEGFFGHPKLFPSLVTDSMTTTLLEHLRTCVTPEKSIAIPLFHLYTIVKDSHLPYNRLKLNDSRLFQALIEAGYCVEIVPVILSSTSDFDGNWKTREERDNEPSWMIAHCQVVPIPSSFRNIFHFDQKTQRIQSTSPTLEEDLSEDLKWPKITYIRTGYEQTKCYYGQYFYYGNEAAPAVFRYFSVAFVIHNSDILQIAQIRRSHRQMQKSQIRRSR